MTSATTPIIDKPGLADLRSDSGNGSERTFSAAAMSAGILVLVILALITYSTISAAWPAFRHQGIGYFVTADWNPSAHKFGILGFVWGTLVASAIGIVLAVPISIGIALFATEVAPAKMRSAITGVLDLLAAIPSVVFGLVGFYVLRGPLESAYEAIGRVAAHVPVLRSIFGADATGINLMTAGIVLAIMVIPIITSVSREVFDTVPRNDKEGALALGATRSEMITGVVLPHSIGGLTGAVMLGLGRAMGETIAVTLLIGGASNPQITADLFSPGDAMPSAIARRLGESAGEYRAALIGLGVTLFFMTMAVNIASRRAVVRAERRLRGAV